MVPMRLVASVMLLATHLVGAQETSPFLSFDVRSARTGKWSDPNTWMNRHVPRAGDLVQVRSGHTVTYDVDSTAVLRVLHVAGTLTFARERPTRLNVGLLKVAPGEQCTEEGFNCHEMANAPEKGAAALAPGPAVLEIGTREHPIPAGVTATVRLVHLEGMDTNTLPALINCGGRLDLHGAPMNRTWVKLGATAKPGQNRVTLAEDVTGWRVGDKIIVTVSRESEDGGSSYRQSARRPRRVETEERFITALQTEAGGTGPTVVLDQPLPSNSSPRRRIEPVTRKRTGMSWTRPLKLFLP